MRMRMILLIILLLGVVALIAWQDAPASLAEGGYRLTMGTTAPGGTAVGGSYTMNTAVGQAEAGLQSGGNYGLGGGFWGGGPVTDAPPTSALFLPVLIR